MPFELGAAPADPRSVPLCVPEIRGNEWAYIKQCLDTGWVSSGGSFVGRFEQAIADYVGAPYGVAAVNGTAALHTALLLAGVRPNDEVLVSALTFVAPANAIRYTGAWPVFIDAEPSYLQMDPQKVVDFLERECEWRGGDLINRRTSRTVRGIVPVHILGHPADLDPILEVARKYGLFVIEDATESLGARYRGRRVGSLGDLGCFSFNGNKLITTGGGGMITTKDATRAARGRYLTTQAKDDPVEYLHNEVGYNYRMTNLQAAMGCAQLEQVDAYIAAKRAIAAAYGRAFECMEGIASMAEAPWAESVYWLYTVRVRASEYGMDSRALMRSLSVVGIETRPLWMPMHRLPSLRGAYAYEVRVADEEQRDALCLPSSVGLAADPEAQGRVVEAISALGVK